MALDGFTCRFKHLKILTEEQVQAIHKGTLEVLWVTGVRLEHERALKLFKKNDCKVDFDEMRVRFPPGLVEECIRKCPSSYHLKARNQKNSLMLGGDTVYFFPFPGMQTIDLDTWEPRDATRKEFYDGVKVLDALPNVHAMLMYTPYFGFKGVPAAMRIIESFAGQLRNSAKGTFIQGRPPLDGLKFLIEMSMAAGQEVGFGSISSPPLTYFHDAIEAAFTTIEAGLPMDAHFSPVYGGTSPATLAGSLIAGNCETLSSIVLYQLIRPGTRVFGFQTLTYPQDMRTGSPAFGDIGGPLSAGALNQIWRSYGFPVLNCMPGGTSSKLMDYQGGYEKAIATVISALTGANIISLHGGMAGELTHHPVQDILDDDIAGMVGRFLEGIEVDNETLAIDLINEVGPVPGHFLNKEHTRKWWRSEQFMPKAADRLPYPVWIKEGKKGCLDYAKKRMEEILATHKPEPLTPSQEENIERILKEAREYYRNKGLFSEQEWVDYMRSLESPNYPYE